MPRKQHYPIRLSDDEREALEKLVRTGQHPARMIRQAQMVLWSEQGKTDLEIAALVHVTPLTVAETRRRWVTEHSLVDHQRPGGRKRLDGKQEAFLGSVDILRHDEPHEYKQVTRRAVDQDTLLFARELVGLCRSRKQLSPICRRGVVDAAQWRTVA